MYVDAVVGGDDFVGFGIQAKGKAVLFDVFFQVCAAKVQAERFTHAVRDTVFGSDARFRQALSRNKHLDGFQEAKIGIVRRDQGQVERYNGDVFHKVFAGIVDFERRFGVAFDGRAKNIEGQIDRRGRRNTDLFVVFHFKLGELVDFFTPRRN